MTHGKENSANTDGKKDVQNAIGTKHAGYAENTSAWKDAYTEFTTNAHSAKEKRRDLQTKKKPYEWEYDFKKPSNYPIRKRNYLKKENFQRDDIQNDDPRDRTHQNHQITPR